MDVERVLMELLTILIFLTVFGLIKASLAMVGIAAIARLVGRRLWNFVAAGLFLIAGTVPLTILGMLWYAQRANALWAMRGPGPFAHLGSGPALLAATTLTVVWTAGFWVGAVWMTVRGIKALRKQ